MPATFLDRDTSAQGPPRGGSGTRRPGPGPADVTSLAPSADGHGGLRASSRLSRIWAQASARRLPSGCLALAAGVKMLALAALGLAGAASGVLPRWLRYTGIALAIAIAASSVAYLLLLQSLAVLAIPAGVLLLVFITSTSITLGISTSKPSRGAPPPARRMPMPEPSLNKPGRTVLTRPGFRFALAPGAGPGHLAAEHRDLVQDIK
jgi:hypothetical protein